MSEQRWRLSGLMFELAVEAFGRDRLPYPLRVLVDDPSIEGAEDYQRLRMQTAREISGFAGHELFDALNVLLEPQIRVEVHGFYGRDFEKVIRVHAGIVGDTATVAVQQPGTNQNYGRDIALTVCPSQGVAAHVVAALPKCAAGQLRPVTARRSEVNRPPHGQRPASYTEEARRIVHRSRSGLGEINVFRGGAIDARPTTDGRGFHWMDYLPADGRYLLHSHDNDEFTLSPGTAEEIQRQLQHLIQAHRPVSRSW
ncbi:ESX secretion-associated protein EspG [Nocardia lijiangensis]|uniref:ESX secretion-associated protein EspG n=1 Tax=Nocardia lijiangensis TaxID=299618 RepID=UPI003D734FEF